MTSEQLGAKQELQKQREFLEDLQRAISDPVKRARLSWSKTLVLNADYRPISVMPLSTNNWFDAIKNVINKKCDVLEVHGDLSIKSPSVDFHIPSILVNKRYVHQKRKVEFIRQNVYLRDGFTCQYCGGKFGMQELTYDHLVPRTRGGKTVWENIVTSCSPCNLAKGHKLHTEWKSPLGRFGPLRMPVKPTYEQLQDKFRDTPLVITDARWAPYLKWRGPLFVNDMVNRPYQISGQVVEVPKDAVGF